MTITIASTTETLPLNDNTGAVDDVAYTAVAAGRMGIMFGGLKLIAVQWAAVSGWTLLGSFTGGLLRASHAIPGADQGDSRIGVWWKLFTGSEVGTVAVGGSTTADAVRAGMAVFTSSIGSWEDPILVSGDDATHTTGHTVVCGAWGTAIAAGDHVVWAFVSDTDNAQANTTPAIVQSGATFGAATQRIMRTSGSGEDIGLYVFEASVTAGSANAPTISYANGGGSSRCGPGVVVRLRESTGGSPEPVSRSFSLVHNTLAKVTEQSSLVHSTFAKVAKESSLVHSTRERLASDTALLWGTWKRLASGKTLLWGTRSQISQECAISWSVRQMVAAEFDLDWDTYAIVAKQASLLWDTYARIEKQFDLEWDVLTSVSRQCEIEWVTHQLAAQQFDLLWATESGLTNDIVNAMFSNIGPVFGTAANDGPVTVQLPSGRV